MWICRNCGTENEDNFKFCWSCGQTREKNKVAEIQKISEAVPVKPELKKEPAREIKSSEEIKSKIEPKPVEETKPAEITNVERRKTPNNETELFSTVLPHSKKSFASNDETDWEIKVFRIAVRLVGLFLIYQFIVALPDLVILISSAMKTNENFSDAMTSELLIPTAKLLFYLIVGIYLIAGGRILIRLLPNR